MSNSQPALKFVKTGDTEPQVFRLYIAIFPLGSGSLCHWSLVLKDSTGSIDLLDANDVGGSRRHEVRDFNVMRKNHLKAICEVANLENDECANSVRITAATEEIPATGDNSFCRTWAINVLKSLEKKGMKLHDEPETIRKAVQHAAGEFSMQYGPEYYILGPPGRT
ncbi:hypothetical protein GGS24DRAFT_496960 [Hypoxylon argillaceum]|nr:hypothetical protein GGS24DRAFT_496960 [Hypoxylon argillaceum]